MLISLQEILSKYNVHPKGVIHVGAHWSEEHEDYLKCGIGKFVYIEPCKEAYDIICGKLGWGITPDTLRGTATNQQKDNVLICNVACGSELAEMPMYVSHQNQGQSNSLLEPLGHLTQHPEVIFDDAEVVKVIPLDKLPIKKEDYQMLAMDVQGYEGEVLKGATETLKHIDIIYTEVNRGETYKGNMLIGEMEEFLKPFGFFLVETFWPSPNLTWGDAIFTKQK